MKESIRKPTVTTVYVVLDKDRISTLNSMLVRDTSFDYCEEAES